MAISDVIRTLNRLKRKGALRDYALMGGVAALNYMQPMFTEDVDINVLVDTDEEFFDIVFPAVTAVADRVEGMHHVISGTPVQLFPSTTKPLYRDAVEEAVVAKVGRLKTKVVSLEHLLMMFLEAFRPKDKIRITALLETADQHKLQELLKRFDDDQGTLLQRLETLQ